MAADLVSRRPNEAEISEGNLAESPIFVLSNKDARPMHGPVDPTTSKPTLRLADYERVIELGAAQLNGRPQKRTITLKANPQFGFPTMFAYRVLLVLMDEAHKDNFTSEYVFLSRHELARRLGYKRPSSANYRDIENALEAMRTLSVIFQHTWHERGEAMPKSEYSSDGLVSSFRFTDDRQSELPLRGDEPRRSYVKLADLLLSSLRAGYFNGIDLEYLNALKSSLAQGLYLYLTKKDANKSFYVEGVKSLAAKVNLKARKPSAMEAALLPALDALMQPVDMEDGKAPRRFLESYKFDKERLQVTVTFFSPNREKLKAALVQAPSGSGR